MTGCRIALAALAITFASAASAEETCWDADQPVLEGYERNSIGLTKDSDDVRFLDVNLSLKYPIAPLCLSRLVADSRLYFAATVRFAQYLGTRESSPVVGKRFNPKVIWRRVMKWHEASDGTKTCAKTRADDGCEYIDFAFAHESDGQSVNTAGLLRLKMEEEFLQDHEHAEFANDYISRGWDYFEIAARKWVAAARDARIDASFRYFLPNGPLQGHAEEYNDWEHDAEGKRRRRVNGLTLMASWFSGPRLTFGFETGYAQPFRYNTAWVEVRGIVLQLPFMFFYRNGYNSDLALYYKRVASVGAMLELARF